MYWRNKFGVVLESVKGIIYPKKATKKYSEQSKRNKKIADASRKRNRRN